jgi:hypothetical protein
MLQFSVKATLPGKRRVYRFLDSATGNAAGRAAMALPCCTVTGVGARVALQQSPILRTGTRILP